jgi:4'-phosphopantetheinyl transferase
MRVFVYFSDTTRQNDPEWYMPLLQTLPASMQAGIRAYESSGQVSLRVLGKTLLRHALQQQFPGSSLDDYRHTPPKAPFIEVSTAQFSISHSEQLVACAIADGMPVGLDVERIHPIELPLMQAYFDAINWEQIMQAPDPAACFYRYWTMKEATLKAAGLGLHETALEQCHIRGEEVVLGARIYQTQSITLETGYIASLAAVVPVEVEMIPVPIAALMDTF